MEGETAVEASEERARGVHLPRLNFRPLFAAAVGMCFGIFLYLRILSGGLTPSDFSVFATFLLLLLPPFRLKRLLAALLCFFVAAGIGAGAAHLYTERFLSGKPAGGYSVEGTVELFVRYDGYTYAELRDLTLDGESVGGKLSLNVSGGVRTGDRLRFFANLDRGFEEYDFVNDIRYKANFTDYLPVGKSADPFLRLNAAVYDELHATMSEDEADMGYALLTGNARSLDAGVVENVRAGGIAHIFAVSGLHIGILYGFARFLFRPLGKYAFLPALLLAAAYAGLSGFSVSALRALIMCAVLGAAGLLGRKYDMVSSVSFAALLVLLLFPAQWLSAGFRLSFAACLGLAFFAGAFSRGLKKLRVPRFFAGYLAATLAVSVSTLPVLLDAFGYFSVWGLLLNLVLIPLLPVLLGTLLFCTFFGLLLPVAASFFSIFSEGVLAAFLFAMRADFSFVVTGFALGGAGVVWLAGALTLGERTRFSALPRAGLAVLFSSMLALCLVFANTLPRGCKLESGEGVCLVRTPSERVLVVGDATFNACEEFLMRRYGGELDAVVLLEGGSYSAVQFLPAEKIFAAEEGNFSVGGLTFRYEEGALLLFAEEVVVAFSESGAHGADVCLQLGGGDLNYFLLHGIIEAR